MSDPYLEANRRRWDALVEAHARSAFYDLEGFRRGGDRLRSIELEELGDVRGRRLLHLQCHFGLDTLAWARRGAEVTGVDFSERAIALARRLSDELAVPARFVATDLYALPETLDDRFDIVFTSYGVLHWLPDLPRWAALIARYLRPGGIFYMVEDHPTFRIFRMGDDGAIRAERRYFHATEPQRIEGAGSYATGGHGDTGVSYIWDHALGEVITSLVGAGLRIEFVHEFPFAARAKFPTMIRGDDGWWRLPPPLHGSIPFLFSIRAHRSRAAANG